MPADTALEMERLIKELEAEGRYDKMRKFLRGGLWDNFLVKYRESNLMHKRMLYISRKLLDSGAPNDAFDHLTRPSATAPIGMGCSAACIWATCATPCTNTSSRPRPSPTGLSGGKGPGPIARCRILISTDTRNCSCPIRSWTP